MNTPACPYCGKNSELVTGRDVYPGRQNLWDKPIYRCAPCGAWVGCHPGTTRALGRLADAGLRRAKMAAHDAFDPLWRKGPGGAAAHFQTRATAYEWLSGQLGVPVRNCHIGMFDTVLCNRVADVCAALAARNALMETRQ
jgi:hypothetical protein